MRKDFKAHEFKKGDMVRFNAYPKPFDATSTLGIVLGQNGMKIHVSWITWSDGWLKPEPWTNAYSIARIE